MRHHHPAQQFSFLLDKSGALGRQSKTATHLYLVKQLFCNHKQMQHTFAQLNKYSIPQHNPSQA